MAISETSTAVVASEQDAQIMSFAQLCAENDLLDRPVGLDEQDLNDGLSDLPTLSYALCVPLLVPADRHRQTVLDCPSIRSRWRPRTIQRSI